MGDNGESVYSPVEPFSGARTSDDSPQGALAASNGAVTLSESIPASARRGASDAGEQVAALDSRPGGVGMQMLRITQCRDPLMWYAGLVGELVPYCGRWREAYKSLEPAGYLNRVEFDDAELVELLPDGSALPV